MQEGETTYKANKITLVSVKFPNLIAILKNSTGMFLKTFYGTYVFIFYVNAQNA